MSIRRKMVLATVVAFLLPLIAFLVEGRTKRCDKGFIVTFFEACMLLASAKTVFSYLTVDKNAETKKVADFLIEEDLTFGYATYWNGNIVTEMSDGRVESANIADPEYCEFFTWSSPSRYYYPDYHKVNVFMF